jgi:predicted O-linked N-acetylglucosamine transferase (SPINDLY family)
MPMWHDEIYRHDKIRVGYVSADFRHHAVSYLAAGLFESHDKTKFETTAISIGPNETSEIRQRLERAFDQFVDANAWVDDEIAALVRKEEIDILVDLGGFTRDARTRIFAQRPAPIQVNYLGYPSTMGADYIDYLMADHTLIPSKQLRYYAEKIVYLPNCYQVNDAKRHISGTRFTRGECGLPENGFIFCCFNNTYKIIPSVFDCWSRILSQIDGSVLWLLEDNISATYNLKREAAARGVNPSRLVFAPRTAPPEHLARCQLADLFLDTSPYNGHTTASDALWAGVPVLTQIGETFAGRVAASLLTAVGLPELITNTPRGYEDLAIQLATNPAKLAAIKSKLAGNRLTTPLFNTQLSTRHIEAAYTAMYERYQSKLPPDHIYVSL